MEEPQELETLAMAKRSDAALSEVERPIFHDRDQQDLARLGKKQVLKRNFGFMSMVGFSCTLMVTWEGVLILFLQGFTNGGPAGLVYGYLLIWVGTLAIFLTLGELASMAPTSGGQYYWVAMLAPKSSRRFLSYITGWLTVIGWQAASASVAYLAGTLIQGLITVNNPSYNAEGWQGTLLLWAVILVAVAINTVVVSALPKIEGLILIIHVLGFFAILIPLVYLAEPVPAQQVFTLFLNLGNWETQGLSFFVGLAGLAFSFLGADGAIHMSEEIKNAAVIVPRSIIVSILLNGVLGFGMLIAILFSLDNVDKVVSTPPVQYPFMAVFVEATGSVGGSSAMIAIVTALDLCATFAIVASSSRMYWAFARDRGLPFWRTLSKVNHRTSIPLATVVLTSTVSCLLGLINIGSAVAFNDVVSLTLNGLYSTYLLCCGLLLWRRCTGFIKSPSEGVDMPDTFELFWGPFKVPGVFGIAVNITACVYSIIILFFSFWPPATPTTAATTNYSVLMTGGVLLFSVIYYLLYARKIYTGPVLENEIK